AGELAHSQSVLLEQGHEDRAVAGAHIAPAGAAETLLQELVPALRGLGQQEAEIVSIHYLVLYQTILPNPWLSRRAGPGANLYGMRRPWPALPRTNLARGLIRADGWERERDACAALRAVLSPDPAAVCFDEPTRYREPESGSVGGSRTIGAPEALEHSPQRLSRHPPAGVLHPGEDGVGAPLQGPRDRTRRGRGAG